MALATVLVGAGFLTGHWLPEANPKPGLPPGNIFTEIPTGSHELSLQTLLCDIAASDLTHARSRISGLATDPTRNEAELVGLLTAVAGQDGASFDAIMSKFDAPQRNELLGKCLAELNQEPATLVRLLGESGLLSEAAWAGKEPDAVDAIRSAPDEFFNLIEREKLTLTKEQADALLKNFAVYADPSVSLRMLRCFQTGRLSYSRNDALPALLQRLSPAELQTFLIPGTLVQPTPAKEQLAKCAAQESRARELFADFDPACTHLNEIPGNLIDFGTGNLIRTSGFPNDFKWDAVSPETREWLSGHMLQEAINVQGGAGSDAFLRSLEQSSIPDPERDSILEDSAQRLFENGSDIRIALDYTNRISDDAMRLKAGADLISKWVDFDPAGAIAYAATLEDADFRERILARAKEASP